MTSFKGIRLIQQIQIEANFQKTKYISQWSEVVILTQVVLLTGVQNVSNSEVIRVQWSFTWLNNFVVTESMICALISFLQLNKSQIFKLQSSMKTIHIHISIFIIITATAQHQYSLFPILMILNRHRFYNKCSKQCASKQYLVSQVVVELSPYQKNSKCRQI